MKLHNRGQLLVTQGLQLHLKICNTSCTNWHTFNGQKIITRTRWHNNLTFLVHDELFLTNRYKIIINRNQVVNTNCSMSTNYYFYFLNFKSTNNICEQYELSVAYKFSSSASAGEIPVSRISTRAFKSSFFRCRSTITELRNSIWAWANSFSSNNLWCIGSVKKFFTSV